MNTGLVHIYTGDGKGKTTAAIGCAVRAAGAGLNVMFLQLFKDGLSSELKVLSSLENITVLSCAAGKFTWDMSAEEKQQYAAKAVDIIKSYIGCPQYDMLIIDEFFALPALEVLTEQELSDIILKREKRCELILTGRGAPESIVKLADYVSEIRCIKHPYDRGFSAREGIEF